MMRLRIIGVVLLMLIVSVSCKKEEGVGGNAVASGKLIIKDVNSSGDVNATFPGTDKEVYIIYGSEDLTYDDVFDTSQDGTYEFKYLREGTYTVFAYSDCDDCDSGEEAISQTFTISSRKEVVSVPDLIVIK